MRLLQSLLAKSGSTLTALGFAPIAAIMMSPLFGPALAAGETGDAMIDPSEIDRAVSGFTGAAIGEVGGARAPADRRLRLSACAKPLQTSWHGRLKSTVKVECAGPTGWRIFVATRPAPQAQKPALGPLIKRGDPITVMVRGRGFSVQQSGEAMENGRVGDWIGIRTSRRGEPVRARIERPGLAIIPVG